VAIDCATVARVYDLFGIDLGDPADGDPPLYVRLMTGSGLVLKLLPVVCGGQLDAGGISAESLLRAIPLKRLLDVRTLFIAEWRDFFRESGQIQAVRVIEALEKFQAAKTKLTPDSPELKRLEDLLDTVSREPSPDATTSPESAV
jgi:hypothetical protein